MKVEEKIQLVNEKKEGYFLANEISELLKKEDLDKVLIIAGIVKDEGFLLLSEAFEKAKKNNVDIKFVIGFDRKTISEKVLNKMLNLSETSYIYDNNQNDNFNAKVYIFKFERVAKIIIPTTNLTANGLTNDYSNVTEITFDLQSDAEEYNNFMYGIKEYIYPDENIFRLLTADAVKELALKRELYVAKDSDIKMPSIEDYLKGTLSRRTNINEKEAEEKIKDKLKNIVKEFDVELDDDESSDDIIE